MNIYVELTRQFNHGRLRAILAGGQAVVLHRLAIMSKDGDWILRSLANWLESWSIPRRNCFIRAAHAI